jgi:DNA adenine methylase
VRPFLKWAGGKTQLLPVLRRFYPARFERYHEPFAGSAAVFFDLHRRGALDGRTATLADSNPDIIGCYQAIQRDPQAVVDRLRRLALGHASGGPAFYYEVRDRRFNPRRLDRYGGSSVAGGEYPAALAAMLIYLNRTGFNGLYRLNARGLFNVPAGRYANPRVCDADNLRRVARALRASRAELRVEGFDTLARRARRGDFIYFDPPYAPVSPSSRFTAYTAGGFQVDDQRRLRDLVVALAKRGCLVVVSNSAAPLVRELYVDAAEARAAGLRAWGVNARRAINSRGAGRGPVMELVISNIVPAQAADERATLAAL